MRKVTLRYFRANTANRRPTIEDMTRAAIGVLGRRWKDREWTNTNYDPPKVLLANHLRPSRHNVFGDLLAMRPGKVDLVIDTSDENVREATTQALPIANANSLVRSSLYWLLEKDHVVLCSSGLQSAAFEDYFTWLLENHGLGEQEIELKAAVNIATEDLRSIKNISLGDNLIVHPGPKTRRRAEKAGLDVETMSGSGRSSKLRDILRAIVGSAAEADQVLRRIPDDQKVSWKFSLAFSRADPEASRAALEHAYRLSMRAATDVSVNTARGKVRGEDFLLVQDAQIEVRRDGLLDRDAVLGAMQDALEGWKSEGRV